MHHTLIARICDPILMDLVPLPTAVRPLAHRSARAAGAAVEGFLNLPALSAYRMTNDDWSVVYYGSDLSREDVLHLFFKDGADVQQLGKVGSLNLKNHFDDSLDQDTDLIIYERPGHFFPRPGDAPIALEVPAWVDQCVRLPESPRHLIAGKSRITRRNRINRFEKLGYVAEYSNEPADLEEFFQSIHSPFIAARHKSRARSISFKDALRSFRKGALVKIMHEGRLAAGTICYLHKDTCFTTAYGVSLDGPEEERRDIGVFLDWHCIQYGYLKKVTTMNIGGSLPVVSDGVFQKKRRWGAKVTERNRTYKRWTFLARNIRQPLRDHINRLGFITEIGGRFLMARLDDETEELDPDGLAAAAEKQGLAGAALVKPGTAARIHTSTA